MNKEQKKYFLNFNSHKKLLKKLRIKTEQIVINGSASSEIGYSNDHGAVKTFLCCCAVNPFY